MKLALSREKLAQMLAAETKIPSEKMKELTDEAKKTKKPIFQVMIDREVVKEEDVTDFFSDQLHIPTLNLQALRIPKEITRIIPKKMIERYKIFPLARIKNLLTVASSDPFELLFHDDVKELTGCDVTLVLAPPKMISGLIDAHYGETSNFETLLENIDEEEIEVVKGGKDPAAALTEGKSSADEAPVVRMVNLILDEAIRARASDIHFEPYEKFFRVRYRVDGALKEAYSHSRELYGAIVARVKIMSTLNITEKRIPQDGRFRVRIQNREIDFRVSVLPMYHSEKIVLRVLDKGSMKSGLDKLGFSERPTAVFADAIKHPYGMILVTGPTGSGKSTTLYTILNTMNTPDRNIMTIEDPVEYQVEGITQTQVNMDVGLTFAGGLRSLLRQSPDIVLVGEIRDTETADIAVKAALTGHLVFSTLHTNSAPGAMTRLMDMGVEPFLIASSVICVAAQRLMRKVCQYCKKPCEVPEEVLRRCRLKSSDMKDVTAYKGAGCAKCNNSGYFGRMGAIEIMRMDTDIRELVIQRKSSDEIAKVAIEKGMETLFQNAFGLFKKGLTTLEEVLRITSQD